jgi:hypothetical protein
MDFKSLADKAKDMFTNRGGAEAAKEDLDELKDIAGKDESPGDKAKDAAEALKDPGAPGTPPSPGDTSGPTAPSAGSPPGGTAGPTAPGTGAPAPSTTPTEPTTADVPPPSDAPPTDPAAS